MKHIVYGVDLAKRVSQLHWVDAETGEIMSKQIKRADFLTYFANRAPSQRWVTANNTAVVVTLQRQSGSCHVGTIQAANPIC